MANITKIKIGSTAHDIKDAGAERLTNKVTSISSSSTDDQYPSAKAVKTAIEDGIATADAMIYKGTIAGGSTGAYGALTAAASRGWTYKVTTAGKIDGIAVEVGDMIICNTDSTAAATSSNYSTIAANWDFIQANIDGAVTGPTSAVSGRIATFNGTSGKVIQDSGYTIATSVPSGAVFTDTKVTSVGNHYTPATDSGAALSASASGASPAWNIDVVKGVTLSRDAKGHVTGVSVTSGKIPPGETIHRAYTSNGTTSTTDSGKTYGIVGSSTSGSRIFTKWFVNLDTGITTPTDGMIISFRLPTDGLGTVGECITIDGDEQHFHQVIWGTNTFVTTQFGVNSIITAQYDASISSNSYGKYDSSTGTYVHNGNVTTAITGVWRVLSLYDSGNTDIRYEQTIYYPQRGVASDGAICRYTLCMMTPDNKMTSLTTTNNSTGTGKTMYSGYLNYRKIYYWNHTDTYAGGETITRGNTMLTHEGNLINYRYTFNCGTTLTASSILYLVGTIDNNGFKLDPMQPWSCSLPNSDDGKIYIYVGMVYTDENGYRGTLEENNTAYWYKNGKVQVYSDYATNADLLDGNHASAFATSGHTHTTSIATSTGTNQLTLGFGSKYSLNAGGTSYIFTMPSNPNTDEKVSQSDTSTTNWRKVLLSFQNGSSGEPVSSNTNVVYGTIGIEAQPSSGTLKANILRAANNDVYVGSTSGSQCHQQYDTTNKCLKFIFD